MEILEHLNKLDSKASRWPWKVEWTESSPGVYSEYSVFSLEEKEPIANGNEFDGIAFSDDDIRLLVECRNTLPAFIWLADTVDKLEKAYPGLMRDIQFEAVKDALARLRRMKGKRDGNT